MKRYPKVRAIDSIHTVGLFDERGGLLIQEKMDGANFRFFVDSDDNGNLTVEFGSRRVSFVNKAERNIPKNFQETIEYVSETLDQPEAASVVADEGPLTVFGESMHQHTIEYDDGTPRLLGFDVWSHEDEEWRRPDAARVIIEQLGFETVPQYTDATRIPVESFEPEEWDSPESHYRDGLAEGIIIRNTHTRALAKLVSEEFAEMHKSGQGSSHEHDPVDARRMAVKYTGNDRQRIRKIATKLAEDEGYTLEMSLMQQLAPCVIEDIGREEGHNILLEDYEVDLHEFRQWVSKLCASELQRMIEEKSDE